MMERLFLRPVKYFLVIAFLFLSIRSFAQQDDSLQQQDSLIHIDSVFQNKSLFKKDSLLNDTTHLTQLHVVKDTVRPVLHYTFTADSFLYSRRLFFSFTKPVRYTISEKTWSGKEAIFYSVVALLLFFALIKNSFSRYLHDLYSSYFRTTMRQKQIKEQLMQSPLPSLFFNIFFVISTAIFLSLIFPYFGLAPQLPFWLLSAYSAAGLTIIYGGKFLLLKFFGWVFQMSDATDTYIFVVFSTNKILGVALLPFTILLAFTYGGINSATVALSFIVIGLLFLYRYFLAFVSINRSVRMDIFHFLIYLAAFEILPLLLINKLLFAFLSEIS
jgi:hypothetical protein